MWRACRHDASCRRQSRSAAGCRRFTPRWGAIMLGFLDEAEIWRRLKSLRIEAYTPQTITDLQALFDRIRADREQRLLHRRRGTRARPARARRAGARPQRTGGRRHQPLDPHDAHDAQRNARALSPRAQSDRRADRSDDLLSLRSLALALPIDGRSRIVAPSSEYAH